MNEQERAALLAVIDTAALLVIGNFPDMAADLKAKKAEVEAAAQPTTPAEASPQVQAAVPAAQPQQAPAATGTQPPAQAATGPVAK